MMNGTTSTMTAPVRCLKCGSDNFAAWLNQKTEIAFARCRVCDKVRRLDESEFGCAVLHDLRTGRWSPLEKPWRGFVGGKGDRQ